MILKTFKTLLVGGLISLVAGPLIGLVAMMLYAVKPRMIQ